MALGNASSASADDLLYLVQASYRSEKLPSTECIFDAPYLFQSVLILASTCSKNSAVSK